MGVADVTAPLEETTSRTTTGLRGTGYPCDAWVNRLWADEKKRGKFRCRQLTQEIVRRVLVLIQKSSGRRTLLGHYCPFADNVGLGNCVDDSCTRGIVVRTTVETSRFDGPSARRWEGFVRVWKVNERVDCVMVQDG